MILPNEVNGIVTVKAEAAKEWHALFVQAEQKIKEIEHCGQGLDIPAINELRYVAFHLLEILTIPASEQADHYKKVVAHLQRAIYDACEALISLQLKELQAFQSDYRLIVVSEVVKNYQELMTEAEAASTLIKGAHRGHEGRTAYYEEALKHVDTLTKTNSSLRVARDELNKKLAIQRRDSRRWAIGITATIVITIIGAIVKFSA